ncbi:MAG: sensor histidine kinase [Phototrophicaceae bacterium]
MKLRDQLLLSYFMVMLVSLGVTAVAIITLLSTRPAPIEPTLREITQFITNSGIRNILQKQGVATEADYQTALDYAENAEIRFIVVRNDQILRDSMNEFSRGDSLPTLQIIDESAPRNLRPRPSAPPPQASYATGSFEDGEGQDWLFVGFHRLAEPNDPNDRIAPQNLLLAFAKPRPQNSFLDTLGELGDTLLIVVIQAILAGAMIATLLAWLIARNIANPLQKLATAAKAVSEGDFTQRVPPTGPQEIRRVANSFNSMSERVEDTQQAQRDLLANVSHDLKTPLTSIQGFSQAILDGTATDVHKAATIIYDEAGRLARMVNQLTELARLRAGRLDMQRVSLDISAMVDAMVQGIEVVAQKKQIQLHTEYQTRHKIMGDGDRLAQVINNLLSNAVKYTPSGGQVWVSLQDVNAQNISLTVRDNGIGIPQEDLTRIFDRFYQVDKSRGPKRGTGLGLAIAQEIVLAHGGEIQAHSEGRGKGTIFRVVLPIQ